MLRAAIGMYPHTLAQMDGRISSDLLKLDFASVTPINRAFAPMVPFMARRISPVSALACAPTARPSGCGYAASSRKSATHPRPSEHHLKVNCSLCLSKIRWTP